MLILSLPISNGAPAADELNPALSQGNRELFWDSVLTSMSRPNSKALPAGKDLIEA